MSEECIIRDATLEDYEEVITLFGLFVENPQRYEGKINDSYKEFLEQPNTFTKLATVDNKIVGFITYSINRYIRYLKPVVQVEEFFVLEEYRRMKIGKKLMDEADIFAKEQDCEYVFLSSAKEREPAHKFYKNYGFDEYAFHYRKRP